MPSRPVDSVKCPLCGKYFEPPTEPSSPIWLIKHAVGTHLVIDNRDPWISAVKCVCNQEFRGIRSWVRHLAVLTGDEIIAHQWLTTEGGVSRSWRRKRNQTSNATS